MSTNPNVDFFPLDQQFTYSIYKTVSWSTIVHQGDTGRDSPGLPLQISPRWSFRLQYQIIKQAYQVLNTVEAFYLAKRAQWGNFLFDDTTDDAVTAQQFGISDGVTAVWQLVWAFNGMLLPATNIDDGGVNSSGEGPHLPGIAAPTIYSNGTALTLHTDYDLNYFAGLVTFHIIPAAGRVLTADFHRYYRCRFEPAESFARVYDKIVQVRNLSFISTLNEEGE